MAAEPQTAGVGGSKRSEPRWRTRLQSGRILDSRNRVLTDCQVHDRSSHGARPRIPVIATLPSRFRFFDDIAKQLFEVQLAWQRGQDAGIRFLAQIHVTESQGATLATKGSKPVGEIAAGPVLEAIRVARGNFTRAREASRTVIEPQAACRNKRLEGPPVHASPLRHGPRSARPISDRLPDLRSLEPWRTAAARRQPQATAPNSLVR
jgi:hypothetical protein